MLSTNETVHWGPSRERRANWPARGALAIFAVALCVNVSGVNCNGDYQRPLPLLGGDWVRQAIHEANKQGPSEIMHFGIGIPFGPMKSVLTAHSNLYGMDAQDNCFLRLDDDV